MTRTFWYYPGCTLKSKAKFFETTTLATTAALGIELQEMPVWNCCGTVYSLAHDDLIHQIAPLRNLVRVRDLGADQMVTLCSMCYNTLKRANRFIQSDPLSHKRINTYLDLPAAYNGEVRVLHLLELLRDQIGFEDVKDRVRKPLNNLKVAPYYGCLLVRPPEVGLDDLEHPTVLESVFTALGAEVVDNPLKTECCGAYQTVSDPQFTATLVYKILNSMQNNGAEIVVTSCPLCHFNLDRRQVEIQQNYFGFKPVPVLYFTQLMALAFGTDETDLGFGSHIVDPRPLLKDKGFIN